MPDFTANNKKKNKEGKDFVDYRKVVPEIQEVINILTSEGSYDDLTNFRKRKEELRKHFENPFNSRITVNSRTTRTDLFKSFICRIVVELYERKMAIPTIDIDPVNDGITSYEDKTKASVTKALLEWFVRVSGYEAVKTESWEDQLAYGNSYLQPFIRPSKKGRGLPAVKDLDSYNILLDPNANSLKSENYLKRAQYWGTTSMYPERNLVDRFGKWILEHAQPGIMVDKDNAPNSGVRKQARNQDYYEVLELQFKSLGFELLLVGGNAFPVMLHMEDVELKIPEDIQTLIDKEDNPVVWDTQYLYQDSVGENILTPSSNFTYFNPNEPRDWGLVDKTAILQVLHEITENMKIDNFIKRLDSIVYLTGGSNRTDKTFAAYRKEKLTNRNAVWNIPGALSKNPPQPGVIQFDGLSAEEGEVLSRELMATTRNSVGVDPQQGEVQKDTGVTQTEIIEEKSTESISAIAEKNLPQTRAEMMTFLSFIIAHDGFGLNDVLIGFTKYDEHTPEGNKAATISVQDAAKKIEGFEFNVIVDKSTLVKKSRAIETERWLKLLENLDPSITPEWVEHVVKQIAAISGLDLPDIGAERVSQMSAQGGRSQFQAGEQPAAGQAAPAPTPTA